MATKSGGATATKTKGEGSETSAASKWHSCKCLHGTGKQCPEQTTKAFARGHDARMASRLAQEVASGVTSHEQAAKHITEAGGGELLVSKMKHSADLRKTKNEAASAPKDPKAPQPLRGAAAKAAAAKKAKEAKAAAAEDADEDDLEDDDEDDLDEDDGEDDAPARKVGDKVEVKHGTKTSNAVVVRNAAGELKARHRLQGKNCDHDV